MSRSTGPQQSARRGSDCGTAAIVVGGVELDHQLAACLTPLFNIASRHPVLNVPSGLAGNGVPTGVQIVARPLDDLTAFQVGAAAESQLGFWRQPDWRPVLRGKDDSFQTSKSGDSRMIRKADISPGALQ